MVFKRFFLFSFCVFFSSFAYSSADFFVSQDAATVFCGTTQGGGSCYHVPTGANGTGHAMQTFVPPVDGECPYQGGYQSCYFTYPYYLSGVCPSGTSPDSDGRCVVPPVDCSVDAGKKYGFTSPAGSTQYSLGGCTLVPAGGVSMSLDGGETFYGTWIVTGESASDVVSPAPEYVSQEGGGIVPSTETVTNSDSDLGCDSAGLCTTQSDTVTVTNQDQSLNISSDPVQNESTVVEDGGVTTVDSTTTSTTIYPDQSVVETVDTNITATDNGTTIYVIDESSGEVVSEQVGSSTVIYDYSSTTINNYDSSGNVVSTETQESGSNPGPASGNCAPGEKCEVSLEGGEEGIGGPGDPVSWWEPKYPDGINQVFDDFRAQHIDQGPFANWLNSWSFPSGGQVPSWTFNFNIGPSMNFGSATLSIDAWLLGVIRGIMIFSAALLARKIIFGG